MRQLYRLILTRSGCCRLAACALLCAMVGCDLSSSATQHSVAPPISEDGHVSPHHQKKIGVLLVSHGSRSESWRKMVLDIEDTVRSDILKGGRVAEVRSAFMEYTEPSIATRMKEFDQNGLTDVILVPLLLTVSSHSFDDIPTIIGQKQDHLTANTLPLEGIEIYKPKARVSIAPLLDFPAVLGKNVTRRVRQMSKEPANEGIILVAYGDKQYEEEWKRLLTQVAEEVKHDTGVNCIEYAWCGHIVHYKSEPTATAIREVLKKKQRALVAPVLVAVDEAFQGKIIGGAIASVDAGERIIYRRDAILPDDNINRWVVDISHKLASKLADQHATSPTE